MKTITCVGTGSKGNAYILDVDGEKLILEAGMSIKDIKSALGYSLDGVSGAIVSHSHLDHSKSEKQLEAMGLHVFAPYHVSDEMRTDSLGNFKVASFPVKHDETENRGFLIRHGSWVMVMLQDFEYCKYTFQKLKPNAMLIECNYVPGLLDEEEEKFAHVVRGHASLGVTMEVVRVNSNENLTNIILCHLSESNADASMMQSEVAKVAPPFCTVSVAEKGRVYQL